MGLPKSLLSAIQSVLNAAARLIARLPRFTHISTNMYMTETLHWLPIASRIKFKVLLVSKSQLGLAPSYLTDFIANQCLQYLPDLCALLIVWIFLFLVSGLPWLNVALLL